MNDAEQIMARVWGRIISEVRKMRDDKYTLERIGSILGVAKPTVQRWLENNAGGEKTAFIDVVRYLKALDIDLRTLLFEGEEAQGGDLPEVTEQAARLSADFEGMKVENTRLSNDLIGAQRELLQARERIIALQDKMLELEKYSAELTDKARRALLAAQAGKISDNQAQPALKGKRRLSPSQFPDLPPIHLQNGT